MCKNSLQNYKAKIVKADKADEMIQGLHWSKDFTDLTNVYPNSSNLTF